MREMKDSGIEWIGEIPADWELSKIGAVYEERNEKVSDVDFQPLSITKQGVVPQLETAAKTNDGENRKLIRKNDFVINSRSDRRGSCGISEYDGSCSLINTVLKPRRNMCNAYYSFVFRSERFADEFYRWGNGIVDDLWSTKWSNMKRIYIPAPSLQEQRCIADYLDRKCSQIDAIIARQQEVIEKLKAYKLSVITEAVTKGLNPDVPMKDSGVEWIGKIPEDWEISKLKFMGHFVNGYAFPSSSFTTDGVRVMKIANIQPMEISWIDESYVDVSEYDKLPMYRVEQGDLVFALTRPIINGGIKVAIFDGEEKVLLNQRNAMFKGLSRVLPRWMYYVMQNQMYVQKFALYIDGTGQQPNISTNEISQIEIPIPPIEVQQQVIMKLNEVMSSIEKLTSLKERMIKQLSDYKKSLIYEVVTGKKEV